MAKNHEPDLTESYFAGLLVGLDSFLEGWRVGVLPRSLFFRLLNPEGRHMLAEAGLLVLHSKAFDKKAFAALLKDEARRLGASERAAQHA